MQVWFLQISVKLNVTVKPSIAPDKRGYRVKYSFLFSLQKKYVVGTQ